MKTASELGISERDLAEQIAISKEIVGEVILEEKALAIRLIPPKSQADLERFWADIERAVAERDEFTQYVIFDSFYLE